MWLCVWVLGAQVAYHALIGLYGKLGRWQESLEAFRRLEGACEEEPPSGVSYNILLDAMFGPEGADTAISALVQNGSVCGSREGTCGPRGGNSLQHPPGCCTPARVTPARVFVRIAGVAMKSLVYFWLPGNSQNKPRHALLPLCHPVLGLLCPCASCPEGVGCVPRGIRKWHPQNSPSQRSNRGHGCRGRPHQVSAMKGDLRR